MGYDAGVDARTGFVHGPRATYAYVRGALFFRDSLWYILSPILAIALFQLSLVWLASALEDIFNPRLRSTG